MPLGDSITTYCWRALLSRKLQLTPSLSTTQINFVGSQNGTTCPGSPYDPDHEGHPGYQAVDVANLNLVQIWMGASKPDIATMHFGTNDIRWNKTTDQIIGAFTRLVGHMRESNPSVYIIVAQIIPERSFENIVNELNARIPPWAASITSPTSPVVIVDQNTGFTLADTIDGTHPNDSGNVKIADKWYPALVTGIRHILNTTNSQTNSTGGKSTSTTISTTILTSTPSPKDTSKPSSATVSFEIATPLLSFTYIFILFHVFARIL